MLIYPNNLETKIGFDQIREYLKEYCIGELGKQYVDKMNASNKSELIQKWLNQAFEFRAILESPDPFPQKDYLNANPLLDKASLEAAFLDEEEFMKLVVSLRTIRSCLSFFEEEPGRYPHLEALSGQVNMDFNVIRDIESKFNDKGILKDTASPELNRLRRDIINSKSKARKLIERILKDAREKALTPERTNLTLRNGRLVIPVLAENKRQLKGFIHDESSTGQTVFIEPAEVLDINNDIKDLEYQEKREIVRILTGLTDRLRVEVPALRKAYVFLGLIDFIMAKTKLAIEFNAIVPQIKSSDQINWRNARHPVLEKYLLAHRKKVVPMNLQFNDEGRIIVISGPNAGGKSVSLKTVGLVQYMLQCGLLIPMDEGSSCAIFDRLLIDIGDEQSLENDLSTYSSHLTGMNHFLRKTNHKTLFLIDEFGSGTEPQFGGAIAESILSVLNQKKALGVVTTHYHNLKKFADATSGIVNAAMRYDLDKMEPLYRLEIGKPGSSFALEIAGKIGLPKEIISRAEKLVGKSQVKFETLVNELEAEKKRFEDEHVTLNKKLTDLERSMKDYQDLKEMLESEKKSILIKAKREAKTIVEQANQKIEATIRQIQETKADKKATQAARKSLELYKESIKVIEKKEPVIEKNGAIKVGNYVKIHDQDTYGEVTNIKGEKAELVIGNIKSKVSLSKLVKIDALPQDDYRSKSTGINYADKMSAFTTSLDLRGKRAEESLPEIDVFIDEALLLGQKEIRILHGKGTGVLRDIVRNHLKSHNRVIWFGDEHVDHGGQGITVLNLDV